jgi:hypothetical protein
MFTERDAICVVLILLVGGLAELYRVHCQLEELWRDDE